ncbi:hypothetical protein [Burkholderia sp. LMG 21824]|uniref:hypothetical protein n=1 Tax=Burkholderia sp. LMG 21824 TaxID=3158172 RepID=UPI003C2C6C74
MDAAETLLVVLVVHALLGAGLFMVSIAQIEPIAQSVYRGIAIACAVVVIVIYLSPLLRSTYTCQ